MQYVLAFLAIIILIVVHEAGHFWVARLCRMKVERFSIFFGPPIASFKSKGTTYQIGTVPLGGFVQITGMNPMEENDPNDPHIYPNRPAWQRFLTILAGPFMNYAAAVVLVFGIFEFFGVPRAGKELQIGEVVAGQPAAAAGFQEGDVFVSIDGEPVNVDHPPTEVLDRAGSRSLKIEVLRAHQPRVLTITPLKDDGHFRIGVRLERVEDYQRAGIGVALKQSLIFPVVRTADIVVSLSDMARGKQKPDVGGPVKITNLLGKQIKRGPRDALFIIASLSIFLGLFNLLPIPALDGGRLAFLLYEIVSRRRVNQRVEAGVHMIGVVVLLGVILLVTFKDVRELFTHGG